MTTTRRALLAGTAALAAGLGVRSWWQDGQSVTLPEDLGLLPERDQFDLGAVPIEKSGWTRPEGPKRPYPPLFEDLDTAFLVVGSGLAGASLALHLAEAGQSVVLIDARQPGWGASGRNAGHVLPTLRDPKVFERFPDKGRAFLDAFRQHHRLPFDLAARHSIDCDAVPSGYINAGPDRDSIAAFRAGTAWMEQQGLLRAEEMGATDLAQAVGSPHWGHGLVYPEGGHINPYLFTNGMAAAAAKLGARVFGASPAIHIAAEGQRWQARTPKGRITADRVIFCTNAYATDVVPEFTRAYYPLTAYGLTTRPLSTDALKIIMPSRQVLSQVPLDLNPLVLDRHNRLILSSIPKGAAPEDANWHFQQQRDWITQVWPAMREIGVELESYWTGRVALRDEEFPGVFEVQPGLYGLMFFNAWGNLMAPLMGKLLAASLAADRPDAAPFPMTKPRAVENISKQDRIIRRLLIPSARLGQSLRLL